MHIEIKQPSVKATEFLNRKYKYLLNIQALCDNRYRFLDFVVRWPENLHDARIFSNSNVRLFETGKIPSLEKEIIESEEPIPIFFFWGTLHIHHYHTS